MLRRPVNKHRAARGFKKAIGRTKQLNIAPRPMRGGIRL